MKSILLTLSLVFTFSIIQAQDFSPTSNAIELAVKSIDNGWYDASVAYYNPSTYQIQPGNSGGALFDKSGFLVGITNAGIPGAQNVGYAIKTSYLKNLVELLPEKVTLNSSSQIQGQSFVEQIKSLQKYIVIVKVKE